MSANAIASVDVVTRIGFETTEGQAVPCTVELPTASITPQSQIASEQFTPQGSKHPGSSVPHKRDAKGPYQGAGCFNTFPYLLHSLVGKDAASPSTPGGATNARQYDFSPKSRGADSRAKSFTTERGPLSRIARTQRMTATRITSFRLEAAQESIRVSGNLFAKYPTTGNYLTGNEVQTVTITGSPDGGTFTLTYSGQTTSGIAYNATAATVQAALEALSNIAAGDVSVTGGPGPGTAYVVEFTGSLGNSNVAQMTASGASLTGGTTPGVTIATAQAGATISIVTQREISREMIDIYLDDAFADLGETKLTGVYTYTLEVGEKFVQFWVFNTDNNSYDSAVEQVHNVTLTFRTAHNEQSEEQFDSISQNLHKYVRFEAVGAEIDTGVNNELARFDFAGKITQATPLDNDGQVWGYEYTLTGVTSSDFGGNVWSARSIVNGALPGLS